MRHELPRPITLKRFHYTFLVGVAATSLAACGGDGGPNVIPKAPTAPSPPVPPPPPSPSPPTAPASIAAPAQAAGGAFPAAVAGGATIAEPGNTTFTLLQTAWTRSDTTLVADTATIGAGATVSINRTNGTATLNVANPMVGVSNVTLPKVNTAGYEHYQTPTTENVAVNLTVDAQISNGALSWAAFGQWQRHTANGPPAGGAYPIYSAAYVLGFETPGGAVPTSGTASYLGDVEGSLFYPSGPYINGAGLTGTANLTADFASRTITGSLTNMISTDWDMGNQPWNSVSLVASFGSGQSRFNGTTAVAATPTGSLLTLGPSATGTIVGAFFGPTGQEIGAVWTLSDSSGSAMGTIGAKRSN